MFNFLKSDTEEVRSLNATISGLEKDKKVLKEEVSDLKLKKKVEEEEIKHLIKINQERKDIELEKEKIKLEGAKAKEIAEVKDNYRDKTEQQLEKQLEMMKGMYSEILGRLPNYNVDHNIKEEK
jgi:lantibiotic modifying enzyme